MKAFNRYINCFSRLLSFMGDQKRKYIFGNIMNTAEVAVSFIMPFILSEIIIIVQSEFVGKQFRTFIILCTALLILIPIAAVGSYFRQTAALHGAANLKKQFFSHIQKFSIDKNKGLNNENLTTKDFITLMTNDIDMVEGLLGSYSIRSLFKFLVMYMPAFFILLFIDWRMAFVGLVTNIVSVIMTTALNPKVRSSFSAAQESLAESTGILIETVKGSSLVRIFSLEDILQNKYNDKCKKIFNNRNKHIRLNGLVSSITFLLNNASKLLGFLFGIYLVVEGQMTLSTVVLTYGLIGIMVDAFDSLALFIKIAQKGIVASERVYKVLDMPLEENRKTEVLPNISYSKVLEFKNVSFSYDGNIPVLDAISFTVNKGETVAIMGSSGGGKSTILKLLQGYYIIDDGEICLYNQPYSKLSNEDIRSCFSYVSQESTLLEGTIKENISYGSKNKTEDEIINAAKNANIHDFIITLPNQYETVISEDSKNISGGQRQRLAIARTFLRDAPILLLDEPTSSLDSESEELVLKSIYSLMKGRTTLVISHRISTIKNVDRILQLKNGRFIKD